MKMRVYRSSKGGWYLFGSNYKDKNDKAYCNVFFPQNSEPNTNGDYAYLDILEAKGTSYKGKFGLTIFKYEFAKEEATSQVEEPSQNVGSGSLDISSDDLPFY